MRQFYVEYSDTEIMEQLVPELKQLLQKEGVGGLGKKELRGTIKRMVPLFN